MAVRHAGFALVACVGEGLINNLIEAAFLNNPQHRTVHLPLILPVGGKNVTLDGAARLMPPIVSLTDGQVHLLVRAQIDARVSAAAAQPLDIMVELSSQVTVALASFAVGDRLHVGVDPGSVSLAGLNVRVLDGSLTSLYGEALALPEVASAIQAAVRALPQSMLASTIDGFPLTATIAPRQMPCGASLFDLPEMFHATVSISRVIPVPREKVLVIGADIAGITSGDPGALRSLFGDLRPTWVRTGGPDGTVGFDLKSFHGPGNLAVSVNPDALGAILAGPISAASHLAFVDCHVALDGLSLTGETFTPNLMPQDRIDGLRLSIGARYYQSTGRDAQSRLTPGGDGTPVRVSVPFAVHLQTWDGPTAFLSGRSDYWFVKVYDPDIELPWWVSFGLILIGVALPGFALPVVTLLDGVIPGVLGNVASQVQRTAQSGINAKTQEFGLSNVAQQLIASRLPLTPASISGVRYAMDAEGIDVYSTAHLATAPDTSPDRNLTLTADGTKIRDGQGWTTGFRHVAPVVFKASINPGVVDPWDADVRASWEVRRSDNHAVVFAQDLPISNRFRAVLGGVSPSPLRIAIDRTDATIATFPGFNITLRVYRPLLGRTKEIGSAKVTMTIADRLDRTHPYVWWSGWAAGARKESALHRTKVPGRCTMADRAPFRTLLTYLDDLPFPEEEIGQHRQQDPAGNHHLKTCDYCFYGGPDKSALLP